VTTALRRTLQMSDRNENNQYGHDCKPAFELEAPAPIRPIRLVLPVSSGDHSDLFFALSLATRIVAIHSGNFSIKSGGRVCFAMPG